MIDEDSHVKHLSKIHSEDLSFTDTADFVDFKETKEIGSASLGTVRCTSLKFRYTPSGTVNVTTPNVVDNKSLIDRALGYNPKLRNQSYTPPEADQRILNREKEWTCTLATGVKTTRDILNITASPCGNYLAATDANHVLVFNSNSGKEERKFNGNGQIYWNIPADWPTLSIKVKRTVK